MCCSLVYVVGLYVNLKAKNCMQSNGASATAFVWHLLYFVPALLYGTKEKGVIERPSGK